jgi:hypothetical protein
MDRLDIVLGDVERGSLSLRLHRGRIVFLVLVVLAAAIRPGEPATILGRPLLQRGHQGSGCVL